MIKLTINLVTICFNRTIEGIKKQLQIIDVDNFNEIELLLSNTKSKIKDSLNLLRSDCIIPLDAVSETLIELDDFKEALKKVVPSSKREGFVTVPNITWDDIGSLKKIRQELHMAMLVSVLTLFDFFLKLSVMYVEAIFYFRRL